MERLQREEDERKAKEDAEHLNREEAERLKREEAERLKRQEDERREQEEEARAKKVFFCLLVVVVVRESTVSPCFLIPLFASTRFVALVSWAFIQKEKSTSAPGHVSHTYTPTPTQIRCFVVK
jgi:hypothetical protein